jgi:hypothetical protein
MFTSDRLWLRSCAACAIAACAVVAHGGCDSGGDDPRGVRKLIEAYDSDKPEQVQSAYARFRSLGSGAVAPLRRIVSQDAGAALFAAKGLIDVGNEEAYGVLVEALNGSTKLPPYAASVYLRLFVSLNRWAPERAAHSCGATQAALNYLRSAHDRRTTLDALRLIEVLRIPEAEAELQGLYDSGDGAMKAAAGRALYAATGRVLIPPAAREESAASAKRPVRCSQLWSTTCGDCELQCARLVLVDGAVAVVAATKAQGGVTSDLLVLGPDGKLQKRWSTSGDVTELAVASDGERPVVAALRGGDDHRWSRAVEAYSLTGDVLWTVPPPVGHFAALTECASGVDARAGALAAACRGSHSDALVFLGASGVKLWQKDVGDVRHLDRCGCLPELILANTYDQFAEPGMVAKVLAVRDSGGPSVSATWKAPGRLSVVCPSEDGPRLASARDEPGGGSTLVVLQDDGAAIAQRPFSRRIAALTTVPLACDSHRGLIAAMCEDGEIVLLWNDCTSAGHLRMGAPEDCFYRTGGLDSTAGREVFLMGFSGARVTVWSVRA